MKKFSIAKFIPVIFAFMTMAYVDLVGISVNYIKGDFGLSSAVNSICILCSIVFMTVLMLVML